MIKFADMELKYFILDKKTRSRLLNNWLHEEECKLYFTLRPELVEHCLIEIWEGAGKMAVEEVTTIFNIEKIINK
jgi:sarcosine oxidase delta subunit